MPTPPGLDSRAISATSQRMDQYSYRNTVPKSTAGGSRLKSIIDINRDQLIQKGRDILNGRNKSVTFVRGKPRLKVDYREVEIFARNNRNLNEASMVNDKFDFNFSVTFLLSLMFSFFLI